MILCIIMEYFYSKLDLLRYPQKYQKTPFDGIDFLNAYKINRLNRISSLKVDGFSLKKFLNSLTTNYNDGRDFLLNDFLCHLLIMSKNKINFDIIEKNTNLILKKFEIKKKLFIKYDSNFKEVNFETNFLRNYMLLCLLCLIQYEKVSSLKYLNSSLKINDLISSQTIESVDDKILFKYLLEKELKFIHQLCDKKEIKF